MDRPLVVQSDGTLLLEVHTPGASEVRQSLAHFAQLEKSPEYFHEYRVTPLSLWNAAQAGWGAARVLEILEGSSRYPVPKSLSTRITDQMGLFGRIELARSDDGLVLRTTDPADALFDDLKSRAPLKPFFTDPLADGAYRIQPEDRGPLKVAFVRAGVPVLDRAGFEKGAALDVGLVDADFELRDYQHAAVDAFFNDRGGGGGSGVVVLPCGAGKTIVGLGTIAALKCQTLILTPNLTSLRQWVRELRDKTTVDPDEVGEYSGEVKAIGSVTVATYQVVTGRRGRSEGVDHWDLFTSRDWGLIIYDEVHLLPAPVFRFAADIQARRRLGLTATLVREDGREGEVFTLIGPKIYELPWRDLERDGHIAEVDCHEIRVDLDDPERKLYDSATPRSRFRISSENPRKIDEVKALVERHASERILVIGQYLEQLRQIELELGAPVVQGKTPQKERERLYAQFRAGDLPVLIVSKVGNLAVDLPDASVAIQVSGTFGSRQEEAQRLGRILRPKSDGRRAHFYSVVSRDTRDQELAQKRQSFLMEQGYQYTIDEPSTGR